MDFEDILEDVGGFGLYQKVIIGLFVPVLMAIPCFPLSLLFMTHVPDHWCHVPEVTRSNLSLETQKILIRPPQDPLCSMYDVNYTTMLASSNWTVDPSWPTKKCSRGWQYDKTHYDATAATRWNMVCEYSQYSSLVVSLLFLGSILQCPIYGFLSDRLGRKTSFFTTAFVTAVTDITSVLSPNFTAFLVLRTINGSSMSAFYANGYVMLLELVKKEKRTLVNGIGCNAWSLGLCLLPLVAYLTRDWVQLSITTTAAAAAILLYWFIVPQSPCWLISQERYEEAADVMATMGKRNGKTVHDKDQLLQKIKCVGENIKKQKDSEEKYTPLDLFRYPILRKRFLLLCTCWISTSIGYYGTQMSITNLSGNEFFNFFLSAVLEIPAHCIVWFTMNRVGRRISSIGAFLLSATMYLVLVFIPNAEHYGIDVILTMIAKMGASMSYMVMYQQTPELLPTCVRGMGIGICFSVATGSTFLAPFIIYLANYGKPLPFLVFSVLLFISATTATFFPETWNKAMPQTISDLENFEENSGFLCCSKYRKRWKRAKNDSSGANASSSYKISSPDQGVMGLDLNSIPASKTSSPEKENATTEIPLNASAVNTALELKS